MANPLPQSLRKRVPIAIAFVLTLFFVSLLVLDIELADQTFLSSLERRWIDQKFLMRGQELPGGEVLIVGIDDKTLDTLGSYRTFERDIWARLVDRLAALQPKAIGFDIYFSEPQVTNPEHDRLFADAVARAGNVVLGVYLELIPNADARRQAMVPMTPEMQNVVIEKMIFPVERREGGLSRRISSFIRGSNLKLNIPELTGAAASFGFVNWHPDPEGFLRHQAQFIDYHDKLYPSLDVQLLRLYLNAGSPIIDFDGERIVQVQVGDHVIPTDGAGRFMLNFNGREGIHQTVSMIDVLENRIAPEIVRDKIVIVGAPAVGLADVVPTPFDQTLPGVELHANVIDNVLRGRFLIRDPLVKTLDVAIILLFGALLSVYLPRMNASRSVFYCAMSFAGFTLLNILSFISLNWVMSFIYPASALAGIAGAMISWKYFTEERERTRTRQTFQYYLDQHVIEQVLNDPQLLKLGGEKREMSVLFSDIRGFTSFSEKMAPTEVVNFLNQYFDRMTGLIFQYKGTLDKLIGDAVMCFWGHPIETKDHAVRATLTALEMVRAVEDLGDVLVLPGGAKFEIGIGVNTGPMVVGNMGSQTRFSYTVMGDNVNLGSRLESLNKYYGTKILISDATYEACKDVVFCRLLDTIQVKGKSQAVSIYEPLGMRKRPDERREQQDRRGEPTLTKRITKSYVMTRYGERRHEERRLGADRLVVSEAQEELAAMYEHALELYRRGDFDGADMAFNHVLSLNPHDGPSRLMKSRIAKYRFESTFDPVYRFDEK